MIPNLEHILSQSLLGFDKIKSRRTPIMYLQNIGHIDFSRFPFRNNKQNLLFYFNFHSLLSEIALDFRFDHFFLFKNMAMSVSNIKKKHFTFQ